MGPKFFDGGKICYQRKRGLSATQIQQALRKCLVTNDLVVTKTNWVSDTDQNEANEV